MRLGSVPYGLLERMAHYSRISPRHEGNAWSNTTQDQCNPFVYWAHMRSFSPMESHAHVKLSGDRAGEYVVTEERPDGSLTLVPDTSWKAVQARTGGREATDEEFAAFEREFGPFLPPDGEG